MDELLADLEAAYEDSGYDVSGVSQNRDQVRVVLLADDASAEQLRSIAHEVLDEEAVLGLDVSTESVEGRESLNTVVTFRYRSS